jgi:hypothetical protein
MEGGGFLQENSLLQETEPRVRRLENSRGQKLFRLASFGKRNSALPAAAAANACSCFIANHRGFKSSLI